jgi:diguanylate cyclase (GGDEF)-like protein/PAS domain S-box-containing protein
MPDHRATITDLQTRINELEQRKTLYHSLYITMTEGVAIHELVTDASGTPVNYRIMDINPACEAMTGRPRAEMVGRLVTELYATDEPPYLAIYAHVAITGKPRSFEATFAPLQKTFRIIAFSPAPGQFATIFCDITVQQQTAIALRESETRYRKVSELISDYAYAFQIEADGSLTRQWATEAFSRITGFRVDEIVTADRIETLIHPDDRAIAAQRSQRLISGYPDVSEFRIITKHGDIRWLRDHAHPVWDAAQARVVRIYGAAQDITERKQTEETLNLFKNLVEHATDGIILMHPDGSIHYANAAAARLLGIEREYLVGMDGTQFSVPEERHRFQQEITPALQTYNQWQGEFCSQRPNGTRWRSQSSTVLLHDTQGNPCYAASIFRDVTHQRQMEEQLRLTQFALDHALDGVAFLDQAGRYLYVNHALCHTLGYTRDELLALRITDVNPKLSPAIWHDTWNSIRQLGSTIFEGVHYCKDGNSFPVEVTSTYLEFEGKACICAFTRNITERKAYQQQIERLAFTDPLTGLANRRRLYTVGEATLTTAIYQLDSIALLYLDLDRFKAFNDTLGHDAGDELLVQVTRRLQQSLTGEGLLARIGGDEFALLLTDTDVEQAIVLAHHILEQLHQPFYLYDHHIYLGGSIGIACGVTIGQPFSTLLTRADIAMYRAKLSSSGVEVYDPISSALSINQVQFEAELRQTLQAGKLTLYYQPILDLTTRQLFGVEALVRWPHPTRGLLTPGSFLPLAEEAGLLKDLDAWVLEAALTQAATWHAAGYPLAVTVNLSAPSLQQANLVEQIVELLAATSVPAKYLVVELTEQTALHDLPLIYEVLTELQALGVRIALDDFGTGYASLSHLRELPVDILKVEHAFAAGIGHNLKDEAVLRAVLTLGAGLEMMVVAEGVEAEAQLTWLREAGCQHIQGYLIGRPMPPEQLNGMWQ